MLAFPSHAAEKDGKTLRRIEQYLTGITSIVADFSQVAPDGVLTGGKFYMKRPGRMRWQYDPPTPILMIADGAFLVYYDYELEQVSHTPLDSTLVGFLARENIAFGDGTVSVESLELRGGSTLRLTLLQTSRPTDGKLTLEFSDSPLQLRNFIVTDAQGQVTTVSLNNARFGEKLDKNLFVFNDPREGRLRRP